MPSPVEGGRGRGSPDYCTTYLAMQGGSSVPAPNFGNGMMMVMAVLKLLPIAYPRNLLTELQVAAKAYSVQRIFSPGDQRSKDGVGSKLLSADQSAASSATVGEVTPISWGTSQLLPDSIYLNPLREVRIGDKGVPARECRTGPWLVGSAAKWIFSFSEVENFVRLESVYGEIRDPETKFGSPPHTYRLGTIVGVIL
ncbi:hypothetical protein B0H16DRAFT_1481362 [Mycena metata]|uniref:Uncharacterized protein n=1 Tax=Mycena metata TaxID=1033252 RepID=A0AAD7GZJ6_9AGAR|nr:hypothetical protein B0H16DRAFT_1481362 [Mycena metata]